MMEEGFSFRSLVSYLLSLLPLACFLLDVVLDALAVFSFYKEEEYVFMASLICLLMGSSALQQIFSWLWYEDPCETRIEAYVQRRGLLGLIHVFQLGIFLRFAGVLERSLSSLESNGQSNAGVALHRHDLSMLRLFEAFSENAPQVVLMLIYIIGTKELHDIPVLKLSLSVSALALTVLSYHRNMRHLITEKFRMGFFSSFVYFLWNLLLIGPRVASVSLFASVLPWYLVAAHVLSSWMLLVFWAWWQKTDFMDSRAGEWLYRATVGLIWYFSWFNVASGRTKIKATLYHVAMGTDMTALLGLWWWRRSGSGPIPLNPYVLMGTIILTYVAGLVLKVLYYWKCHPNKAQVDVRDEIPSPDPEGTPRRPGLSYPLEMDFADTPRNEPEPHGAPTGALKRMRNMAAHFYC